MRFRRLLFAEKPPGSFVVDSDSDLLCLVCRVEIGETSVEPSLQRHAGIFKTSLCQGVIERMKTERHHISGYSCDLIWIK
jgi:hypothetical protein